MDDDIDLRGALASLGRYARLILATMVLGIAAAGVASFFQQPLYAATALVLVDPRDTNLLDPGIADSGLNESARVDSEVEILLSDGVLLDVVERLQLSSDPAYLGTSILTRWLYPEFTGESGDALRARALRALRAKLRADRRGLTHVISVEALAGDPDTAATLANTVVAVYVERQVQAKIASVSSARGLLDQRIETTLAAAGDATASEAATRSQLTQLQDRARDLDALAGLQIANSRLASAAIAPILPAQPNRLAWLAIGCVLGLVAGCVIAYIRETLTGGIYGEEDAERRLAVPVLGTVPNVIRHAGDGCPSDEIAEQPLGAFANGVRVLRANLDLAGTGDAGARVVAVCSSRQREGKTVVSRALARSYAMAGQRALLIDCDLRSPQATGPFHQARPGLAAYLRASGDMDLQQLVTHDAISGANILPAGEPLAPSEVDRVIVGPVLTQLIAAARSSFDVVILDCAALEHAADALYLAPLADTVMFVAHRGTTPYRTARRHLARLDAGTTRQNVAVAINRQAESGGQRPWFRVATLFRRPFTASVSR